MKKFELARRALGDLQEIWEFVSEDSFTAADRLLEEFYNAFQQLAEMPGTGHKREDVRPELGWSIHMTGGWATQFDRVRRWHDRLLNAHPDDEADFLYAFFENAFHLRDWLLDTGAASKADVNELFARNVEMRLRRDLANAHKHFSLRQKPSQPNPPSEVREYVPGDGSRGPGSSLVIISEREKYDPIKLARPVLRLWEEFIERNVAA